MVHTNCAQKMHNLHNRMINHILWNIFQTFTRCRFEYLIPQGPQRKPEVCDETEMVLNPLHNFKV